MTEILCIQHVACEGPAAIGEWAESRGHRLTVWRMDVEQRAPKETNYPVVIVLGGPMGVLDDRHYPWLRDEKRYLFHRIADGRKLLGICLGAQLLAHLLGAEVWRNHEREIGWYPLQWRPDALSHPLFEGMEERFHVLHWHQDTFAIPLGAKHLAQSEACRNQAFLWKNRILGLQFHLETMPPQIEEMIASSGSDLEPARFVQDRYNLLSDQHRQANHRVLFTLLDRFIGAA